MEFYIFFVIMFIISAYMIYRTWRRYTQYSNGYYKNGGQDIILWCGKSEGEIIEELKDKEESDTLDYEFYSENNTYYLKVLGIRRYRQRSFFSALFTLRCIPGQSGTYIVVSLAKRIQMIYSSGFEAELYEFFVKKLGCIAKEKVV